MALARGWVYNAMRTTQTGKLSQQESLGGSMHVPAKSRICHHSWLPLDLDQKGSSTENASRRPADARSVDRGPYRCVLGSPPSILPLRAMYTGREKAEVLLKNLENNPS